MKRPSLFAPHKNVMSEKMVLLWIDVTSFAVEGGGSSNDLEKM